MTKGLVLENRLVGQILESITTVKGRTVKLLDLRQIENAVTDFFVVVTGTSHTHVEAIVRAVEKGVGKTLGQKPWHVEGLPLSEWVLIDYVDVVVHVFQAETRAYYDLEGLWGDAVIAELETQY